jgi:hypothetical protein
MPIATGFKTECAQAFFTRHYVKFCSIDEAIGSKGAAAIFSA